MLRTCLDARSLAYNVTLFVDATRPVTQQGGQRALAELRDAGVVIEDMRSERSTQVLPAGSAVPGPGLEAGGGHSVALGGMGPI